MADFIVSPGLHAQAFELAVLRHAEVRPKSWAFFVVVVAIVLSLFSKFPTYTDANAKFPGSFVAFPATEYGKAIGWWLQHPFQSVPIETFFPMETRGEPRVAGMASHCDKLTFRVFIPLLNQLFGGGIWTLVIANHLASVLTFCFLYQICLRVTANPVLATLSTWAYGACWAGSWGFNDIIFGDSVAVALLLGGLVTARPWLVAILVLAACLTDERAVGAAPILGLFRYWERHPPFGPRPAGPENADLLRSMAPIIGGVLAYAVGRLGAASILRLQSGTSMMGSTDILLYHFYVSYPVKIFTVFEFLWVFPILFVYDLSTKTGLSWRRRLFFIFCLTGAAVPAFLVWDVDRSLCYLLPGALAAICFSSCGGREINLRMGLTFVASLLWMVPNESWMRYFVF